MSRVMVMRAMARERPIMARERLTMARETLTTVREGMHLGLAYVELLLVKVVTQRGSQKL